MKNFKDHLFEKEVDIYKYPKELSTNISPTVIVGDLQGNAIKLLWILIYEGFVKCEEHQFEAFKRIYLKHDITEVNEEDIADMEFEISELNWPYCYKDQRTLYILGDDLADRGMNDYYTLLLYKYMEIHCVHFKIIASNHGMVGLCYHQGCRWTLLSPDTSWVRMDWLRRNGIIDSAQIDLMMNIWLTHLYMFDVVEIEGKPTILSHAPFDFAMIRRVAKKLGIVFKVGNLQDKIEVINDLFFAECEQANDIYDHPYFFNCWWNINQDKLKRPKKYNFIHGHMTFKETPDNVICLDNRLGAGVDMNKGIYNVVYGD